MAERVIGYFLEDIVQERFLEALVARIAEETGLRRETLRHEPRNVTGGRGAVMEALREFLLDVRRGHEHPFDALVVAVDANCDRYTRVRRQIEKVVAQTGYTGTVVCAIPNPHVERWYLADVEAFPQVVGQPVRPTVPRYKCERGRYKRALREAFRRADIEPPLGGAEYGEDFAAVMDLYRVGQVDPAFDHFIRDMKAALGGSIH